MQHSVEWSISAQNLSDILEMKGSPEGLGCTLYPLLGTGLT